MSETAINTTKTGIGGVALVITRVLSGVLAAMILLQGALAGSYLSGNARALGIHEMLGTEVLTIISLITVVTALIGVRRRWWPLPVAIVGFVGIGLQIGMGFAGEIGIHLPLGIGLFGLYLTMALTLKTKNTTPKNTMSNQ